MLQKPLAKVFFKAKIENNKIKCVAWAVDFIILLCYTPHELVESN